MEEKDILLSPQMLDKLGKQLGYSGSIPPQFIELASSLLMGGMAKNTASDEATDTMLNDMEQDSDGETIINQLDTDGQEPELEKAESKGGILDNLLGNKIDPLAQAFAEATGLPKDKAKKLMMILAPILLAMVAQRVTSGNQSGREGLKNVIKKTYKNPPQSQEEFRVEQKKLELEQRRLELERQRAELEQRQHELTKQQQELSSKSKNLKSKNKDKKKNKYQIPNKDDGGLLEKLLDKDGDGSFVDEAVGILKKLLLK